MCMYMQEHVVSYAKKVRKYFVMYIHIYIYMRVLYVMVCS